MNTNVACSYSGCTNPVIGQCVGYHTQCGRFYCREHSLDKLCWHCAQAKLKDEEEERVREKAETVYKEYAKAVEQVHEEAFERCRQGLYLVVGAPIGLFIVALLIFAITGGDGSDPGVLTQACFFAPGVVFVGLIVWHIQRVLTTRQELAAQMEATKPQFTEFYREYKKQGRKQLLSEAGTLATIVLGVAAAAVVASAVASSDDARLRDDIRAARRKLDEL